MDLSALVPAPTDRATFVGQTGSGKSTLAQALLAYRKYVLVHDGKGTLKWPGFTIVRSLGALWKLDPVKVPRIIYRPDIHEQDEQSADDFFSFAYERRRTTVYIDEVYSLATTSASMPFHLRACLTRGREHGVEVWAATQRPTWIPREFLSEAEHVYCFRLRLASDRARVEESASIDALHLSSLGKRQFIYSRQDGGIHGPLSLSLSHS